MTRHIITWRFRWGALLIALTLASAIPASTTAWNQEIPPGGVNAIGDCQGTNASPCIRWRKNGSQSIVIQAFLDASLDLGYIDLATDAQDAINAFNGIEALNPLIQVTNDQAIDEITVEVFDYNDYQVFGGTTYSPWPFSSTTNRINHAKITFNTEIVWRRQTGGWCDNDGAHICHADARKVANHELGHAEGLAHEDGFLVTAVMVQGFVGWFALKPDDRDGIIAIYGAAP
jgi:hypothetical protein